MIKKIKVLNVKHDKMDYSDDQREYDIITFVDPKTGVEKNKLVFETTNGYGKFFAYDYRAYDYDGNLLPTVDPYSDEDKELLNIFSSDIKKL